MGTAPRGGHRRLPFYILGSQEWGKERASVWDSVLRRRCHIACVEGGVAGQNLFTYEGVTEPGHPAMV